MLMDPKTHENDKAHIGDVVHDDITMTTRYFLNLRPSLVSYYPISTTKEDTTTTTTSDHLQCLIAVINYYLIIFSLINE